MRVAVAIGMVLLHLEKDNSMVCVPFGYFVSDQLLELSGFNVWYGADFFISGPLSRDQ